MKTEMIHARIDKSLKHDTEEVFKILGINTADAIRMFFKQVTLRKGLPFEVKIPNIETVKAMEELQTNKNLKSYSAEEFHELLDTQ
jgi:DNA-damage-inducible protein J